MQFFERHLILLGKLEGTNGLRKYLKDFCLINWINFTVFTSTNFSPEPYGSGLSKTSTSSVNPLKVGLMDFSPYEVLFLTKNLNCVHYCKTYPEQKSFIGYFPVWTDNFPYKKYYQVKKNAKV